MYFDYYLYCDIRSGIVLYCPTISSCFALSQKVIECVQYFKRKWGKKVFIMNSGSRETKGSSLIEIEE
jgi:hypothetical protein